MERTFLIDLILEVIGFRIHIQEFLKRILQHRIISICIF